MHVPNEQGLEKRLLSNCIVFVLFTVLLSSSHLCLIKRRDALSGGFTVEVPILEYFKGFFSHELFGLCILDTSQ